jgi:PPOX class probable F420-dependent enzyme
MNLPAVVVFVILTYESTKMNTKTLNPEIRAFLQEGTRTGKLATVRADGRPHVAPVWFVLDGDTLIFTTGASSVKAKNFRRDARVAFSVDDERPLYSFAVIEGTVETSEDMSELKVWTTKIAARYMGADRAEEYGVRNAVEGELLVRLHPTHVLFARDIAR